MLALINQGDLSWLEAGEGIRGATLALLERVAAAALRVAVDRLEGLRAVASEGVITPRCVLKNAQQSAAEIWRRRLPEIIDHFEAVMHAPVRPRSPEGGSDAHCNKNARAFAYRACHRIQG